MSQMDCDPMNAPRHPFPTAQRRPHALAGVNSFTVRVPPAPDLRERQIAARARIFSAGDRADNLYELVWGRVILWSSLPDGRRQILQIAGPGTILGFAAEGVHTSIAEAIAPTRYRQIPVRLQTGAPDDPSAFYHHALSRIAALEAHALLLGRMTALERVARFLAFLISDEGPEQRSIPIPVTRAEIADYLGLTIETVSRNLTKLRRAGGIAFSETGDLRVIDLATLMALSFANGKAQ